MVNNVLQFIREKEMLLPNDRVIVGVSGGADSVCLLDILIQIKEVIPITIYVVHIEHGIRGEDSIKDAEYVKLLAVRNQLEFKMFSYDVLAHAYKNGLGTEEMARILRYQAFEIARKEFHCNKIAVAHNKNDNAETLLLHLFRGSGLKGLSAIMPVRDHIIRPLLCVERCEIEDYLKLRQIDYCTDYTNFEDDYTRNKIRLNVLSYVKENINQKVISHVDMASRIIYEAWEFLEEETYKVYSTCVESKDKEELIKISKLNYVSDILKKNIIRKCIENVSKSLKDITNIHVELILSLQTQQVGKLVHLPYGIVAKRGYEEIIITTEKYSNIPVKESILIQVPGVYYFNGLQFIFSLEEKEKNQIIPENRYTKWFDYDKIGNGLLLRTRETGDYFVVNLSGGTKKLKSYFIDEKIEREKRDGIPVLCDKNHVIWAIGYRISEAYKVKEDTKKILRVQVNGGNDNGR